MEQKTKTHPKQRSHTEGNTRALYFARNCYVWQSLRWSIVAHETVSRRAEEGWAVRESTHAHRRLDATKSGTDFKIFWARAGVRLSRRRFQEERKYDLKPDVFFEGNEGPKSRAKAMGRHPHPRWPDLGGESCDAHHIARCVSIAPHRVCVADPWQQLRKSPKNCKALMA